MKNIRVDLSVYLLLILSFLSGNFKNIIIYYLIIVIHELGHIFIIKLFNKEIVSIKIYIFGGISKYNTLLNHNIFQELMIAMFGIITQLVLFIIFNFMYKMNIINNYTYQLFLNNNISLIIFNLLPIIGLDGEKILHLVFEYFFSYKFSNRISLILSFMSLIIFMIVSLKFKLNILYVSIYLVYKHLKYIKELRYIENKYLLERYLYDIPYKKIKYLKRINLNKLKQETYFFFNNIKEYDILREKYFK